MSSTPNRLKSGSARWQGAQTSNSSAVFLTDCAVSRSGDNGDGVCRRASSPQTKPGGHTASATPAGAPFPERPRAPHPHPPPPLAPFPASEPVSSPVSPAEHGPPVSPPPTPPPQPAGTVPTHQDGKPQRLQPVHLGWRLVSSQLWSPLRPRQGDPLPGSSQLGSSGPSVCLRFHRHLWEGSVHLHADGVQLDRSPHSG